GLGLRVVLLPLLSARAVLAGGAAAPGPVAPPPRVAVAAPTEPAFHGEILVHAFTAVGTPDRGGGSAPETGFDCSGLINYVFREAAGVTLPSTSAGLSELPRKAATDALQPGDLVLSSTRGKRVDHAGIYVGDGRSLHAPSSGGRVRL